MDTNLQCVVLSGTYVKVSTVEISNTDMCTVKFIEDVSKCNSHWSEFLRLMFYNETTKCWSFDGITTNSSDVGSSGGT